MPEPPRVRFAPSPTGALHIGGARTALYNWLVARHGGGEMLLRIEDTDRERSTPENVGQILDALRWLELDWDGEPISQHARRERHRVALERLLESGHAYRDPASSDQVREWKRENDRGYRGTPSDADDAAVRLRVPDEGETVVSDVIRGPVRFANRLADDPVIARSDGSVLYNFAVAVDDAEMGITDVVRGDDHLSNTPKQLLVLAALDVAPPRYAHLPLLHGPDGSKLSKRHGAASVQELRDRGYLPAAVRNYLALLGWGTDDDETILSTNELVERFELEAVGKASAIFDERKLRWVNGRFMREAPLPEYEERVAAQLEEVDPESASAFVAAEPELRRAALEIVQDKAQTVSEVWGLIGFLFVEPAADPDAWSKVMTADRVSERLGKVDRTLEGVDPWRPETIEAGLRGLLEAEGWKAKQLFQPIRVAISGTTVSPGIFESLAVLGRDRTLERVRAALARIEAG